MRVLSTAAASAETKPARKAIAADLESVKMWVRPGSHRANATATCSATDAVECSIEAAFRILPLGSTTVAAYEFDLGYCAASTKDASSGFCRAVLISALALAARRDSLC